MLQAAGYVATGCKIGYNPLRRLLTMGRVRSNWLQDWIQPTLETYDHDTWVITKLTNH